MEFDVALIRLHELAEAALALLPGFLLGLLVLRLLLMLARVVRGAVACAADLRAQSRGLALVLGCIGGGLTVLLDIFVAAAIAFPSISAAYLFGVLGIGGVAIGSASRDILQNLLAGTLLLLPQPFRLGAQIKAGNFEGKVEDIQIRATTIRTYNNRRGVIPNCDLFYDKVLVNTVMTSAVSCSASGSAMAAISPQPSAPSWTPPAAQEACWRACSGDPRGSAGRLCDAARPLLLIDPPQRVKALDVIDHVLERAKTALTCAGIDLPFPPQHILFHDKTEASDGDRAKQREGWPLRPDSEAPAPRWRVMDGIRWHASEAVRDGEGAMAGPDGERSGMSGTRRQ